MTKKDTEIGGVAVTTSPPETTPPAKPTRKARASETTVVEILRRKKPVHDKPQEPRPLEFVAAPQLKDKGAALKWVKDNGDKDYEYMPVRRLSNWRTVTVTKIEKRELK